MIKPISPFMNGELPIRSSVSGCRNRAPAGIEKSVSKMGGTIFLFFILSQFVAYFTYTNIGTILALKLAGLLQSAGFRRSCCSLGSLLSSP